MSTEIGIAWTESELRILHALGLTLRQLGRVFGDRWLLKGTACLLAYMGARSRLPNDVDVLFFDGEEQLLARLDALPAYDDEGGQLRFLRAEPIRFTPGRPKPRVLRVLVVASDSNGEALLRCVVDALLVSRDEGERVRLWFPDPQRVDGCWPDPLPALPLERILVQKLIRITLRRTGGRINTRWMDLRDVLTAAQYASSGVRLPALVNDLRYEFATHRRELPEAIPDPPREWLDFWDAEMFRTGLAFGTLDEAAALHRKFWQVPLRAAVMHEEPRDLHWSSETAAWR